MAHDWPASEPYFERLDLRADLPGIAFAPPEESGWINSHEALHEDLYFTLMEIFQRRSGRAAGDRRLQPGQIVPDVRPGDGTVRLRIATRSYPAADAQVLATVVPSLPTALAEATEPLAPAFVAEAFDRVANRNGRPGVRFVATSRQGRPVHGVHHRGSGPAVLISGGQHANETSGVVGALRAAQVLATRPDAHFAVIPLENPDGYALHQELCVPAPRHMHHAARYTALGDDVEYRDAPPFFEREARLQALRLSGADLHVNLHGYPAHEWTRPMSGYIPRGFAFWTIPKGFFLIVRHHAGWGDRARRLTEHVCLELARSQALMEFNRKQLASYNVHAGDLPFEVIHGTACMISEVDRQDTAALTLITEFPDETIYGAPFVFAHDAQAAAALAAVDGMRHLSPNP
ncbi:MAG: M14 family zinc carboxypeptidase [Pseudomonadota bacterium]